MFQGSDYVIFFKHDFLLGFMSITEKKLKQNCNEKDKFKRSL